MEIKKFDCVVIGSGIAGLTVALRVSRKGYKVALVSKEDISDTNTSLAQGGIAAVVGENDSFKKHINDTLLAGDGLCRKNAVEYIVEKSPGAIRWLAENGVRFNTKDNGEYVLGMEGAHSEKRIVHYYDHTGRELQRTLEKNVLVEKNISVFENFFCHKLYKNGSKVCGSFVFNRKENKNYLFSSQYTVLCTGGLGHAYSLTTNWKTSSGDGYILAMQAGAELANMEFVQFHPTSFYHPESKNRAFLISEALRGAGAVLKDIKGNEIMKGIHPMESLAPRDIIARRIFEVIQRDCSKFVYLDAVGVGSEKLKNDYPDIYSHCKDSGIDITKDYIPVSPAAHYSCGGINSNLNSTTSVEGLLVCGEAACTGIHGANRLASNSLLEAVVFSEAVANYIEDSYMLENDIQVQSDFNSECSIMQKSTQKSKEGFQKISEKLINTATKYAGILRNTQGLKDSQMEINLLKNEFNDITNNHAKKSVESVELFNLLLTVEILIKSSIIRKESRGAFFNSDYPKNSKKPYESQIFLEKGEIVCRTKDL